jgi:hypothetical protein
MALDFTIPKDLGETASKLDGLNQLANQYVVAPIAGFGIGGFKFSAFKEYKGELKSQITDNYNEKNIALQDNIALEPELFTLSGIIGEISYLFKDNQPSNIKKIAEKLTTLVGFLPAISSTLKTLHASINSKKDGAADYADATLGSALDLYQTYQKLNPPKTMQAKAYNYFLALRNARVLISFDTPYGFKGNYAILNLVITQPEYTDTRSDVVIILKEIRQARTSTVKFDPNKYQGRAQQQNQPIADKGNTQGKDDGKTFAKAIADTWSKYSGGQ